MRLASDSAGGGYVALEGATKDLDPPFGVLDVRALSANAFDMLRRANGTTIRVASKSIRCRAVLRAALALDGYAGILAYTLPEALWLATEFDDIVVGYPTVDRAALRTLAANPALAARITLMIDSVEHLDLITGSSGGTELRVCVDIDASLEFAGGRVHLGARRSPVHSRDQAVALARAITDRPGVRLVGLMAYEGQIAGLGDNAPSLRRFAIRAVQEVSRRELRDRRAEIVAAVREVADLEFVNGGGTGSLESTSAEEAVTEIAAGSGLFAPTLFDTYRQFTPTPAAFFVLPVVRKPTEAMATVLGGGWIASGAIGDDRLPTPGWPEGLSLTETEGAGEVQTPLTGAADLRIGDRVWFRHTKAGELCEHLDELHVVDGDVVVEVVPTYRGEGKVFL